MPHEATVRVLLLDLAHRSKTRLQRIADRIASDLAPGGRYTLRGHLSDVREVMVTIAEVTHHVGRINGLSQGLETVRARLKKTATRFYLRVKPMDRFARKNGRKGREHDPVCCDEHLRSLAEKLQSLLLELEKSAKSQLSR